MSDTVVHPARTRLHLIGGFSLCGRDGAPVAIPNRRARALIGYLCLAPGLSAGREHLCGLLWSDRAEAQARASLRQCLFELRDGLEAAGADILDVGRDRLALRPDAFASDVGELLDALAGQDPDAIVAALGAAGRGRLLEGLELGGLFQEWLDQARPKFDQDLAAAVQQRLEGLGEAGEWAKVRAVADAFLQRDPLDQSVVAAAMRAEAAAGNPSAALRRFQTLKNALAREFGVAPGPAAAEAMAAIAGPALQPAGAQARSDAPVLAVLAFDNLTGSPDLAYFADGVSAEIQQTVARASGLKVIARSSSFQFRGPAKAARNIAAELKATHVLDGSVRRSGTRLRINAELVACRGETTLWSEQFDRDLSDIFALQDEIAGEVARALKVAFAPAPSAGPIEPVLYETYLLARDSAVQMDPGERLDKLRQVAESAPRYAPAWAWLAWWQAYIALNPDHERPCPVDRAAARRDAQAALDIDPASGIAYAALGLLEPLGRYAEREALFRKAVAAAPTEPVALYGMGILLDQVGRTRESLELAKQSYDLDPLYPQAVGSYMGMLFRTGRYEEGQRVCEACRQRWPNHWWFLVPALAWSSSAHDWTRFDAVAKLIVAAGLDSKPAAKRAFMFGRALREHDEVFAQRVAGDIEQNLRMTGAPRMDFLTAAVSLGLVDQAFSVVERADYSGLLRDDHEPPGGDYTHAIIFDLTTNREMIHDVRFVTLCAKLGLCDYWVRTGRWPDVADQVSYDFRAEARRLATA